MTFDRDKKKSKSLFLLFLGQISILILCILFIAYFYFDHIKPDKEAKENFADTTCKILSKKLTTKSTLFRQYRADFLISYAVGGNNYLHFTSGNGLDLSFSYSKHDQQDILNQFTVGNSYSCFYDPSRPEVAILVLRHNWLSMFPLIIPSVIILLVLYYALATLLGFISTFRNNR